MDRECIGRELTNQRTPFVTIFCILTPTDAQTGGLSDGRAHPRLHRPFAPHTRPRAPVCPYPHPPMSASALRRSKRLLAAGDFAGSLSAARSAGSSAVSATSRAHAAVMEAQSLHELGDADGARTVAFDALNSTRDPPVELVLVAASVALAKGARRSAQAVLERALERREGTEGERAHLAGLLVLEAYTTRQADEARAALARVSETISPEAAGRIGERLKAAERSAGGRRGRCRVVSLRTAWEAVPFYRRRLEDFAREAVAWAQTNPVRTRRVIAAALCAAFVLARIARAANGLRQSGAAGRFVRSLLRAGPP